MFENALEQVAARRRARASTCAWAVEHHFLEEYSHCSAPELFLTAVAMQTQRIRVGHGAVVCVPEMNHPIRVAERAAFLDILSGGRLEFGTARSSTWTELGGFEADPDRHEEGLGRVRARAAEDVDAGDVSSHDGTLLLDARARGAAEAAPEAAPADVGDGDEPRHRARRRRPRPRLPRRRRGELRRAGAPHARVPPPHPALRAGRAAGQRPRGDPQLPLLPRGRRRRGRATGMRFLGTFGAAQRAPPVHARGLSRPPPTRSLGEPRARRRAARAAARATRRERPGRDLRRRPAGRSSRRPSAGSRSASTRSTSC